MFLESGFTAAQQMDKGVFHVTLQLEPSTSFTDRAAARSQQAAAASMRWFFEPTTVAVIGANRERGRIGSEILHNLRHTGFTGTLVAVHPQAETIDGIRAYPAVTAIPGTVDLAVIVVPAAYVASVLDDCISKGVKAVVVISAGFAETGGPGKILETALVEKIRAAGIRMIGPNCMGIINTDGAVQLNATFSPVYPPPGRVAFSTQSGALGLAILEYVKRLNLGISSFASIGNKADVSSNDLIQYWAADGRTEVILLYLESFGNPRKFAQIARRVGRKKPIVAVKAGRSTAGARAASSHTGARATNDVLTDTLLRQAGVIRTHTLEEMFDVASLLASQPVPAGPRVAIVTNAGGPGILAADACEANGLQVTSLARLTIEKLREFLPASASVANPVDMIASASADHYRRAVELRACRPGRRQPDHDLHSPDRHCSVGRRRCDSQRQRRVRQTGAGDVHGGAAGLDDGADSHLHLPGVRRRGFGVRDPLRGMAPQTTRRATPPRHVRPRRSAPHRDVGACRRWWLAGAGTNSGAPGRVRRDGRSRAHCEERGRSGERRR